MASKTKAKRRTISPHSERKKAKDRKRLQLIDANMTSIAAHGLSETTISHISQAAGMSRGIINFYFDSKEMMMRETLEHLLEERRNEWTDAVRKAGSAGANALEALVQSLFSRKLCTKKTLAVWTAFVSHAAAHAPYRYAIESFNRQLREAILMNTGDELEAERILTFIHGAWVGISLGTIAFERQELVAQCMAMHQPKKEKEKQKQATPSERKLTAPKPTRRRTKVDIEEPPVVADLFALM